jgi:hypothetical protein
MKFRNVLVLELYLSAALGRYHAVHDKGRFKKGRTTDTWSRDGGGCKVPIGTSTDQDDNEDQAERGGRKRVL